MPRPTNIVTRAGGTESANGRWHKRFVRPGTLSDRRSTWVRIAWVYLQLIEANRPMTARELAERWETSTKTINRDMESLRMAGLEIVTNRDGVGYGNGYTLTTKMCPMCHKAQGPNNESTASLRSNIVVFIDYEMI